MPVEIDNLVDLMTEFFAGDMPPPLRYNVIMNDIPVVFNDNSSLALKPEPNREK